MTFNSFQQYIEHCIFGHEWVFAGGMACEQDLTMNECPGFAYYECRICGENDYGNNLENSEQCKHCPKSQSRLKSDRKEK